MTRAIILLVLLALPAAAQPYPPQPMPTYQPRPQIVPALPPVVPVPLPEGPSITNIYPNQTQTFSGSGVRICNVYANMVQCF